MMFATLFFSADMASNASARTQSAPESKTAESLNTQELHRLSSYSPSADCGSKTPTSLFAFTQTGQNKKTNVGEQECNNGGDETTRPPIVWRLFAGDLIGQQIINWGKSVGWHVIWLCDQDWVVPSAVNFQGEFIPVTEQVLEDLAAEGASIHGIFYNGNHTLVITGGNQ